MSDQQISEFSIPMRGNESVVPGGVLAIVRRFSIPMRGNEDGGPQRADRGGHRFSIPMRGNEIMVDGKATLARRAVFDPHEG